jgi:hypothetical protein
MYKHSNEIEEVAVVNLVGVNIESNPDMEMLLGVRALCLSHRILSVFISAFGLETLHVHLVYILQLLRPRREQPERVGRMDCQTRSDTA